MVLGVMIGSVELTPTQVWQALTGSADPMTRAIVWEIRLPRVILGALAGAGLALAGLLMQVLVRNVLADPYVLGINSGASVGAAGAMLFGLGAQLGDYALQASAFAGALAASALIFALAGRGMSHLRLLMAGVAVGYALSAATSFLVFASDSAEGARSVMFWLLGSLGLARFGGPLLVVAVVVVTALAATMKYGPLLDALSLGDDTTHALGLNPEKLRKLALVGVCLLVGALVAMVGSIGFVGLIVPHVARRCAGAVHRRNAIITALLGAVLLVVADLAARTLMSPQELPIGIITALVGAPFLLILVRKL
ncbi:iron ABC transporter permease [Corynebacterium tapiri]|uniref:Iron ABC transporter permease n=2 Tax=Corynebacterium tapiri TaxID=1448266 RepID=A0A5C4U2E2_9CORY|nr:iron ABC transporter permease [Corynebacterium tapiri]